MLLQLYKLREIIHSVAKGDRSAETKRYCGISELQRIALIWTCDQNVIN